MRNKSGGNGSKNRAAFRNLMRNGIAIGNNTWQLFLGSGLLVAVSRQLSLAAVSWQLPLCGRLLAVVF